MLCWGFGADVAGKLHPLPRRARSNFHFFLCESIRALLLLCVREKCLNVCPRVAHGTRAESYRLQPAQFFPAPNRCNRASEGVGQFFPCYKFFCHHNFPLSNYFSQIRDAAVVFRAIRCNICTLPIPLTTGADRRASGEPSLLQFCPCFVCSFEIVWAWHRARTNCRYVGWCACWIVWLAPARYPCL